MKTLTHCEPLMAPIPTLGNIQITSTKKMGLTLQNTIRQEHDFYKYLLAHKIIQGVKEVYIHVISFPKTIVPLVSK